jgi:Protein of unknown function (DUF998)
MAARSRPMCADIPTRVTVRHGIAWPHGLADPWQKSTCLLYAACSDAPDGNEGSAARYALLVRTASTPWKPEGWTRGRLRCGLVAGPVFVAVFLGEGAVRDGYQPLRHPVSSLALGPGGWVQAVQLASWRTGRRGFGLYSAGTAITMLATMALAAAGFGQSPRLVKFGGLFQRASIITGFAWLAALSAQALHATRAS